MSSVYLSDDQGNLKKIANTTPNAAEGIDEQLNLESVNPVQNKVITNALNNRYTKSEVNKLIDDIPEPDLSNYYNKGEVDKKIDDISKTDLSEYYTKSETVFKIVNNINVKFAERERQKSETDGAIVHENIIQGMAGVVLWENPYKKADFVPQVITMSNSLSNFDYCALEYETVVPGNETINCRQYSYFRPIVGGNVENLQGGWDSGTRYIKARAFRVLTETTIDIYTGWQEDAINDRMMVPLRIIGYKKGV